MTSTPSTLSITTSQNQQRGTHLRACDMSSPHEYKTSSRCTKHNDGSQNSPVCSLSIQTAVSRSAVASLVHTRISIAAHSLIVKSLGMTDLENHGCGFSTYLLLLDFKRCFSTKISSSCWTIEQPVPPTRSPTQYLMCLTGNSTAISATSSFGWTARPSITNTSRTHMTLPSVYLSTAFPFSTRGTSPHGQSF